MGLYDYLTLTADKTKWTNQLAGSFSISLGDNVEAFIGSGMQTHVVGDDITYIVDWERFLEEILHLPEEGIVANAWNAVAGTGGYVTFTYGRNIGLTYLGPKIDIQRGPSVSATSQSNFFGTSSHGVGPLTAVQTVEAELKQKIDTVTGVIVALLSTAMVAVNTGLEIKAKIDYQTPASKYEDAESAGEEDQASDEQKEKGKDAVEKMEDYRTIVWMLTNRLMAFIIQIEKCAVVVRTAATDQANAVQLGEEAASALELCTLLPTVRQTVSDKLDAAGQAIDAFIKKYKDALIILMAVLGIAVVAAGAMTYAFVLAKH